jgi:hypothetical protein
MPYGSEFLTISSSSEHMTPVGCGAEINQRPSPLSNAQIRRRDIALARHKGRKDLVATHRHEVMASLVCWTVQSIAPTHLHQDRGRARRPMHRGLADRRQRAGR